MSPKNPKPDWFDLENYAPCAKFSTSAWWSALDDRECEWAEYVNAKAEIDELNDEINQERAASIKAGNEAVLKRLDEELQVIAHALEACKRKLAANIVKRATKKRHQLLLDLDNQNPENLQFSLWGPGMVSVGPAKLAEILNVLVKHCDEREEIADSVLTLIASKATRKGSIRRFMHYNLGESSGDVLSQGIWMVDLTAPDEKILADAKAWLKQYRKQYNLAHQKRGSASLADLQDWHIFKILAYKDLIDYGVATGQELSNTEIARLLFPNEIEVDVVERTRKIVPKTYDEAVKKTKHIVEGY